MAVQIWRSQLIWIYTVCKGRLYSGSAGQGLKERAPRAETILCVVFLLKGELLLEEVIYHLPVSYLLWMCIFFFPHLDEYLLEPHIWGYTIVLNLSVHPSISPPLWLNLMRILLVTRSGPGWIPLGPATFFPRDWSWNIFYSHYLPSAESRSKGSCQFLVKECVQ